MRFACCTLLAVLAAGCVHYRYDVTRVADPAANGSPATAPADVAPADAAIAVLADRDLVLPAAPARLRVRQVESRCVVLIENPTETELSIESAGSAIVDPSGQTRPVAGQLIPPGAFAKLILPPLRDAPPAGTGFHFGVGVLVQADTPRPAAMLQTGPGPEYWEWNGDRPLRLVLTLRQAKQTFRHEWTITRTKV